MALDDKMMMRSSRCALVGVLSSVPIGSRGWLQNGAMQVSICSYVRAHTRRDGQAPYLQHSAFRGLRSRSEIYHSFSTKHHLSAKSSIENQGGLRTTSLKQLNQAGFPHFPL